MPLRCKTFEDLELLRPKGEPSLCGSVKVPLGLMVGMQSTDAAKGSNLAAVC